MTAAIALAVVLVIAVAGASMALESQRSGQPATRRPARPARPARSASPPTGRRGKARSGADPTAADGPPAPVPDIPEPELKAPDLLHIGVATDAKVISVVDERTIGPVTRSRLSLRIEPPGGEAFEVTVRVAFQTPGSRADVKVGGTVPVRYDPDDHSRVVVELPRD